jgi:hypothetical protein
VKIFLLTIGGIIGSVYILSWVLSLRTYPVTYGISFNQDHAASLGLDWKDTYEAMLSDLQPKYIRIAAMWNDVESEKGIFDFSNVDFMMNEAQKAHTKVLLVVGQKAPRWPECHVPAWYKNDGVDSQKDLLAYVETVVKRYKNHQALELWQVENEPFIQFAFGDCEGYDPTVVAKEIALVRSLDNTHKTVVTDSGELSTWHKAIRAGDIFGTTLYRVVRLPNGMIFYYDWLPAGFYHIKAALFGKKVSELFVAELQAEPWFTDSNPNNTEINEQEKTMNPQRLEKHLNFVTHIGAPRAYLWGVEWWYWMKQKKGDSRYWELIQKRIIETNR